MSLWNMPDGCMDASDLDYYNRINPPVQCPGCLLAVYECECCKDCGATPDQACDPDCGLTDYEDDIEYWQERSELFAPPNVIHERGIE